MAESLEQCVLRCREAIKYNLVPSEILDSLVTAGFITEEEREDLMTTETHQWISTAGKLLDILSKRPNWGRPFMTLLQKHRYVKLVKIIEDYPAPDIILESTFFHNILNNLSHEIYSRELHLNELILYLKQAEVLDDEDEERILQYGRGFAANRALLRNIYRKTLTWFPDFLWALMKVQRSDVVAYIIGQEDEDDRLFENKWNHYELSDIREKCKEWFEDCEKLGVGNSSQNVDELVHEMFLLGFADSDGEVESAQPEGMESLPSASVVPRLSNASEKENLMSQKDQLTDDLTTLKNPAEVSESSEDSQQVEIEELELRIYQLELAQAGVDGENCIVVAPTGTGKTHVALWIAKNHLEVMSAKDKVGKIAFFVPTVELVTQQTKMFKKYLSQYKSIGRSGADTVGAGVAPFGSVLKENSIIVLTAEILHNALIRDEELESLSQFSLLFFDECHHCKPKKKHTYKKIMCKYLREKLVNGNSDMPQVIGLTASVGTDKADTKVKAKNHILALCGCLNADSIQTVHNHVEEMDQYRTIPIEEIYHVGNRSSEPFSMVIWETMKEVASRIKELAGQVRPRNVYEEESISKFKEPPAMWDSERYTGWVNNLFGGLKVVKDDRISRAIYACIDALIMYNEALFINDYSRSEDAFNYIEKSKEKTQHGKILSQEDDTDRYLKGLLETLLKSLEGICKNQSVLNPKLEKLKEVIVSYRSKMKTEKQTEIRLIIFCKTRELTRALENWMKNDAELTDLNAHHFTSTHEKSDKSGLTEEQRAKVMKNFHLGVHKVIVATTVAEEGLDIAECNLVIRYSHVTNETSRIQTKGRGRAVDAHYVLIGEGKMLEKEELNRQREELMMKAVAEIGKMPVDNFRTEVRQYGERFAQEQDITAAVAKYRYPDLKLKCRKCRKVMCTPDDLRTIERIHHAVITPEFYNLTTIVPLSKIVRWDAFEKLGKLHCKKCHLELGIQQRYRDVNFNVIQIKSFFVENSEGQTDYWKKWSEVKFEVDELSDEEAKMVNKYSQQRSTEQEQD